MNCLSAARGARAGALRRGLASLLLVVLAAQAAHADTGPNTRGAEIAECRPGELRTWGDGRDRAAQQPLVFAYEPAGAPAWLPRREVHAALEAALAGWGGCGLAIQLLPLGQMAGAGTIRVRWDDAGARGNFGLANLGARTLSLSPSLFALLRQRNPGHPAEQTLTMTLAHESGHFLGLMAHSRRCVDVMSYYDDGRGGHCELRDPAEFRRVTEYRSSLPTACDIARCRAVNGTRLP